MFLETQKVQNHGISRSRLSQKALGKKPASFIWFLVVDPWFLDALLHFCLFHYMDGIPLCVLFFALFILNLGSILRQMTLLDYNFKDPISKSDHIHLEFTHKQMSFGDPTKSTV